MGAVLRENSREHEVVGRYGGEEFLVVMPNTPKDVALRVAERIRSLVEGTPFEHADGAADRARDDLRRRGHLRRRTARTSTRCCATPTPRSTRPSARAATACSRTPAPSVALAGSTRLRPADVDGDAETEIEKTRGLGRLGAARSARR